MYNNNYINQGLLIKPNVIAEGDNVTLRYDGLLAKSGATHVYAHCGFGTGNKWDKITDIPMNKTSSGFECTLNVTDYSPLNIAFRDCANNWDNNSGTNYVFNVQSR